MNQTNILLQQARSDYLLAMNALLLVQAESMPSTIEDIMFAYLVAKDWSRWLENPQEEDSPIKDQTGNFTPLQPIFKHHMDDIEKQLIKMEEQIAFNFESVVPYIIDTGPKTNPCHISESTKLYISSLYAVAEFFAQKRSNPTYLDILEHHD